MKHPSMLGLSLTLLLAGCAPLFEIESNAWIRELKGPMTAIVNAPIVLTGTADLGSDGSYGFKRVSIQSDGKSRQVVVTAYSATSRLKFGGFADEIPLATFTVQFIPTATGHYSVTGYPRATCDIEVVAP